MLKIFYIFAFQMKRITTNKSLLKKKLATALLIFASFAAFATLGDGGKAKLNERPANKYTLNSKNFSLRSGYNYRSNNLLFAPQPTGQVILNNSLFSQKVPHTYILPQKRKILLDKITFKAGSNIRF